MIPAESGELQVLPRAYVGAIVIFRGYQTSMPALVVAVYAEDVCDLVLHHAPRNGACTTFRGRVAHIPQELEVRPSDSGWHCIPAPAYVVQHVAKGAA